jgi:predicted secreted acid phosphatase
MKINKIIIGLMASAGLLASCKNEKIEYPNFAYSTVYFASQYPVRTVELGEDLFIDNSLDNQHKIAIKATMGGEYENKKAVLIDVKVDETLLNNLYYSGGGPKILAMPAQYYQLAANQITIPPAAHLGV